MVRRILAAAALAALAQSCAGPTQVSRITSTRDQIKFGYSQGTKQGIVQCDIDGHGELSDCRELPIRFRD